MRLLRIGLDPIARGLALRVSDGQSPIESGQLGGPDAPVPFVARGRNAVYTDAAARVAGVTKARLVPGAVLADGRRKWTVRLELTSAAAAELAPPSVPALRLRIDGSPPCAATRNRDVSCEWRSNGALLRCSRPTAR